LKEYVTPISSYPPYYAQVTAFGTQRKIAAVAKKRVKCASTSCPARNIKKMPIKHPGSLAVSPGLKMEYFRALDEHR
jgi:hypothetical protein